MPDRHRKSSTRRAVTARTPQCHVVAHYIEIEETNFKQGNPDKLGMFHV